ncbi:hypothetical protein [Halopseudomonas salegens]|uniref:Uncharacterized protein n=1 Tax=Halopseudomonas salegens TaxID=1434072 RepID=A0A1H2GFK2_9GAMM|nr:hypothetical protein [Halopseudomonas salegens]SDU18453.1 hypothetical protein SAMN05216210_2274 [Halopseudomonas salegens]
MKSAEPALLDTCRPQQGYDRLLRRLDQALDMARTRQWLAGHSQPPLELEVKGLSAGDLLLLQQVLTRLGQHSSLAPPLYQAEQQYAADDCCQRPGTPA